MASIDGEYYLDAEGDALQDAYDRAVEEEEEMMDWEEVFQAGKGRNASRKNAHSSLPLYRGSRKAV